MRHLIFISFCLTIGLVACSHEKETTQPNIVIIFLDDSGWADFEPFGEVAIETPHVTQLAADGCAFHNFYVPQ
ncbi:MAG: sulfatase-like hydrolase/transferase, partial [Bacteroidales bacterium]|nr:sulfatase-like hydrolase/transferase [Bacteroidales bacterium]